jgi:hypothetical protein
MPENECGQRYRDGDCALVSQQAPEVADRACRYPELAEGECPLAIALATCNWDSVALGLIKITDSRVDVTLEVEES